MVLIDTMTPAGPLKTGVMVLCSDDESFPLMTPEGHPESGWVTFSAFTEGGSVIAQVQTLARANDPIYELGFRVFGNNMQDRVWSHVVTSLAAHFGVQGTVQVKACTRRCSGLNRAAMARVERTTAKGDSWPVRTTKAACSSVPPPRYITASTAVRLD